MNLEVMNHTPEELPEEELDAREQLDLLREQLVGGADMEEQLREAAAEGDERAIFALELQERVTAFIRDTAIPMAEAQEWDSLNDAQDVFVKQVRDMAREANLPRGEAKEVAKRTDKVIDLFEEMIKEENEPGLARSLAAELWYLVPFAGPVTQIAEAKLGHDLKGRKLTERQQYWREVEGKVWLAADCAGGVGVVGRLGEVGVKAGAKTVGKGLAKGAGKRAIRSGAGIKAGKLIDLGRAVKNEGKVVDGAIAFARHERSMAGILDDAAVEVGEHGLDVALGPNHKTARQLMEERQRLAESIEFVDEAGGAMAA